jgi:CDP-4-dehydro-6-deoxyglucose reductase, E3
VNDWIQSWRRAFVVANREVAQGTRVLTLHMRDEHPSPYEPGHVISLRREGMRHPYTVSMVFPERREIELLYRVIPHGRLTPTLATLQAGDLLEISGLHHQPVIDEVSKDAQKVIGLATGSGVGPLYGFAARALGQGFDRPIALLIGYREAADIALSGELNQLAADHLNFRWHATLSRPDQSWTGLRGRIGEHLHCVTSDPRVCHFHLVGNVQMLHEVEAALSQLGVPDHHISDEGFFNWNAEADPAAVQSIIEAFHHSV